MKLPLALLLSYWIIFVSSAGVSDECAVCVSVVDEIVDLALIDIKTLPKEEREVAAINAIEAYCAAMQQNLETSQRKMCYYLEPLRQTAARALLMKMTSIRTCRKLSKENPDICNLVTVVKSEAHQRRAMSETTESVEDEKLIELFSHDKKWYDVLDDEQFDAIIREYLKGVIYI
jgi:hypothetical protein